MNVPYNNGKIEIGKYYQPPKYIEYDSDMLEIQKWLIGDPHKLRIEYWSNIAYMLILIFLLLVVVLRS
jgi:hypothetical protein